MELLIKLQSVIQMQLKAVYLLYIIYFSLIDISVLYCFFSNCNSK